MLPRLGHAVFRVISLKTLIARLFLRMLHGVVFGRLPFLVSIVLGLIFGGAD